MGKFLDDMISLGVESLFAFPEAKKKAAKAKEMMERLTSGSDEVPIEEFLEVYDLRIHDFDNKQDDIKFMKNWDFEGVYILHNCTRKTYHVGRGSRVLRKIDRIFRGYENQDIYEDWSRGDKFTVWIVPLENSGYSDTEKLEKEIRKQYGVYPKSEERDIPHKEGKSFWRRLFGR